MSCTCGCCEGIEAITPMSVANQPGRDALVYRVGTHATFLETMEADLGRIDVDGGARPLAGLATRAPADVTIALLDAWATIADVLSFYQERIANEGYLRTATERRSVLELARLVGFEFRPGVAASAYLAFTLDDGYELTIPARMRAQTVPGPGETPQPFETTEELEARAAWNALRPRRTAPQVIDLADSQTYRTLYLADAPNVGVGDPILLVDRDAAEEATWWAFCRVIEVEEQPDDARTRVGLRLVARVNAMVAAILREAREQPPADTVAGKRLLADMEELASMPPDDAEERLAEIAVEVERLQHFANVGPWAADLVPKLVDALEAAAVDRAPEPRAGGDAGAADDTFERLGELVRPLLVPATRPPATRFALSRTVAALTPPGDAHLKLVRALYPTLDETILYRAIGGLRSAGGTVDVYALRVTASLFGQAAPKQVTYTGGDTPELESPSEWDDPWDTADDECRTYVYLDTEYEGIERPGFAVIESKHGGVRPHHVNDVRTVARSEYGLTGKSSRLTVSRAWWKPRRNGGPAEPEPAFSAIRTTVVHARSERLSLAEAPVDDPVRGAEIDLSGVVPALLAGRWLIVKGKRILDWEPSGDPRRRLGERRSGVALPTVPAAELVMLADVTHGKGREPLRRPRRGARALPGEAPRTWLTLATPLAYVYERASVEIFANVAHSTHGETRTEVLGSGDATRPRQRFQLRQALPELPLTFVSAPTASGIASSLEVRVDDVRWHEVHRVNELGPNDREYLTETGDDQRTDVLFGDGFRGARLPSGIENVKGRYRVGIGKVGNARAEQISQLGEKPLGVKSVVNPLRASGGADRDSRDAARALAPLSVTALDRLVSLQDYTDFARLYAGIGKATAVSLSDGRRRLVHVTVAGVDDIPIDPTSNLLRNLCRSLQEFGDPSLPVVVAPRELLVLVIGAKVRVLPDFSWPLVEPKVRSALLDAFGFDRRSFGQDVTPSDVVAAIQRVRGVAWVDLDMLHAIPSGPQPGDIPPPARVRVAPAQTRAQREASTGAPAGLAGDAVLPAQLAILVAGVPETLQLSEAPS